MKNSNFWGYVQTYPRCAKRAEIKPEAKRQDSGIDTRVRQYELKIFTDKLDREIHNMDPKPLPKKTLPKSSIVLPDYGKDNSSNSPSQRAVLDYLISWHEWYNRKYLAKF